MGKGMTAKCCGSMFIVLAMVGLVVAVNTTIPAPIVEWPSQYWEGNEGPWSTFTIQVGTPAQDVRLLISTAGTSTFVVTPEGCTVDDPSNCADLRGEDFVNRSSTFGLDENFGMVGNAEYGFDNVGIGWQGSSLRGLTQRARDIGVFGSLDFGGYDTSKAGTNMSFAFGPDYSRDLTVGLQSISGSIVGQKQWDLLPQVIFTFIDSTTPYIWLPLAACQAFEKAFGLSWGVGTGLYLVNDTLHSKLIGNATVGGSTIDITLPYASFDLTVGYPIVPNNTRYFPIIRAANDTQYTLGRTFLTETYLIADYEREKFYLSQTNFAGPKGSPLAVTVGVKVGVLILSAIAIITFLFLRRRRRNAKVKVEAPTADEEGNSYPFDKKETPEETSRPAEIHGVPRPISEVLDISTPRYELMAPPPVIFEMPGDLPTVPELSSPDGHVGSEQELPSPHECLSPAMSDLPSPLLAGRMSLMSALGAPADGHVSRAMSDVSGTDDRRYSGVPSQMSSPSAGVSPHPITPVSPVARQSQVMKDLLKTVEDFHEGG
ncbi:uncharacterized protein PAC_08514 [Phialocephala subalpina]|uniref:Peptidase A1 domain-containing protein n=1 Tax=Phialocephala subalpina TaxID=576137 RepID=A0A1L7X0S6_9HELO|nr:uncharacterized protein PAC_08514 [Phialocephala subalpina]